MSLRRESPIRGRPIGRQFLLHLAPRIDKVLIPWTNERLSSAGIDTVDLVTTTGARPDSRVHNRWY
jgi:hypothetical protein